MQDLSSEDKKTPPKNYQKQPKNYPRIVFGHKKRRIFPYRVSEIHVNLQHRK